MVGDTTEKTSILLNPTEDYPEQDTKKIMCRKGLHDLSLPNARANGGSACRICRQEYQRRYFKLSWAHNTKMFTQYKRRIKHRMERTRAQIDDLERELELCKKRAT